MHMANATILSRASLFAAAIASVTLPTAGPSLSQSVSGQVVSLEKYRAIRESAGWSNIKAKLKKWRDLPDDWDHEGGVAPSTGMVEAAEAALMELALYAAPLPVATIAGDGEIAFEWTKGTGFASLSFTDDGHVIAFLQEDEFADPLRIDEVADEKATGPFLERIGAFA